MAANAGRALLISIDLGSGSTQIAGQSTSELNITRSNIPVTTKSDAGVRQLLAEPAEVAFDVSFEGVLKDAVYLTEAFNTAPTGLYPVSVVVGDIGTVTGNAFLGDTGITGEEGDSYIGLSGNLAFSGAFTFSAA